MYKRKVLNNYGGLYMKKLIAEEYKRFEDIKQIREDGSEFWSARELAVALDYTQWRNFTGVIKRAMIACENSGHDIFHDFAEVSKIVEAGATNKPVKDYELSRYACYLIVQNGDPRKEVVALGQTYFAIQTYRQEVADHFNELSEDNRRLVVRGDIKQWNQMLAETAHKAGVITNEEFAIFQNAGYMGLYGGLDVDDIHAKKGLEFGKGEGKVPLKAIAERAKRYQPKPKITYKMIQEYVEKKYGFKVHTAYIAEVKRSLGLMMYDASNAAGELQQPRKHLPKEKADAIMEALKYFGVI